MAKAKGKSKRTRSRHAQKKKEKEEIITDEESDEELDEEAAEQKIRKRSQVMEKQRLSRKKQDKIVLLVAAILILATAGSYFYYAYILTSSEGSDEDDTDQGPGNYTGTIQIISDVTHTYGKESWHIINIDGFTNYILKVKNTGTKKDTYKFSINNLDNRIKITFNKNNFELQPNQANLFIANVTTTINYEYRLPTPIDINLFSTYYKSIIDTVKIDITVEDLNEDLVVLDGDKVQAYYTGAFEVNGSLFDYSFKDPENKKPLYISLSDDIQMDKFESIQYVTVILGFKLGLIGMLPEETHVIVVPPELGYPKDQDLGGKTLIFEVKLLKNDRDA